MGDGVSWDGIGRPRVEKGGEIVLWFNRIGFKNCVFVLKLQLPSEIKENQTAKRITVTLEEQAANVPEVGTSQTKAQSVGSSWHIAHLLMQRRDVSSCIAIFNAVQNQTSDTKFLVFSTLLMLYINTINNSLGYKHEALLSLSIWVVHKLSQQASRCKIRTKSSRAAPEQWERTSRCHSHQ